MEKGLLIGVVLGLGIGALVMVNCKQARKMVEQGQQMVMDKLNMEKKQPQENNA